MATGSELMVHEIAVNGAKSVGLGLKLTMGRTTARGLGKRPVSVRRLEPIGLWVPARAVLALLLALVAVRTVCVPTRVVLKGDCWAWLEELLTYAP